jgi:hypothetical protein
LKFCYFSFLGVGKQILAGLSNRGVTDTAEKFISGVVDTGKQFLSGIVDTGDKFFAFCLFLTGINDTGEKCYRR